MATLFRRNNGIWYIVYSVKRRRRWLSTNEKCFGRAVASYRANSGLWIKAEKATVKVLFDMYAAHLQADHAAGTIDIYQHAFSNFERLVGEKLVQAVTVMDGDRFKMVRVREVSGVRTNMELRALKAAFNRAVAWKLIERNPFMSVKPLRIPKRSPEYLTLDQFTALWSVVEDSEFKVLICVAVMTMMRRGELLNLHWTDVDFARRIVRVRNRQGFTIKGMKERSVPMNELVVRMLQAVERRSDYVFSRADGTMLKPTSVSRKFKSFVRKAGLPGTLHFHSLRHTGASWLAQQSVSLLEIQKILGHSSPSVTQIYAHLSDQNLLTAVEKISHQLAP